MDKENNSELVAEKIKGFINEGKYAEALDCVSDADETVVDKISWELVPIVVKYLTEDNLKNNNELFQAYEDILCIIAGKCNADENVLLFLEQIECLDDDVRFLSVLKPLQMCLSRSNLSKVFEWVGSSIRAYIENLPLPENKKTDEISTDKHQQDPVALRLQHLLNKIVNFLKSLTTQINSTSVNTRYYALNLYFNLFGKPFSHLDVKPDDDDSAFHVAIREMARLTDDLLEYGTIINERCYKNIKNTSNNIKSQLFDTEINDLAYSNYYFVLLTSNNLQLLLPQIYNPKFVMHFAFYLSNCLLKQSEYILVSKGLRLIDSILIRIDNETVDNDSLESMVFLNTFENLSQVMIYCDSKDERNLALKLFRNVFHSFTMRAKYLIIVNLLEISNHSGLLALIINIVKDLIIKSIEQSPNCEYFVGKKLNVILAKICKLPNGSTSDLVEISDEIIATLNLLRFLIIRDKSNVTGIWDSVKKIQEEYLKPLREGIDLAKAHWRVKIKDLEEQKKQHSGDLKKELMDQQVSLIVGGESIPQMPISEKIKFCFQAINALDVIESICIRLTECLRSLWSSNCLLVAENKKEKIEEVKHESEEDYEKNIKSKILSASLPFVPDLGWSQQAISAGAESIGYPGIIHGMFPGNGAELVLYFYAECNAELNRIMKEKVEKEKEVVQEAVEKNTKKVPTPPDIFVRNAVEIRLRMLVPYKSKWPQAMAILTLPPNAPKALANLLTLVDDICYYAGDRSVNINWYTRRVVLAGIYKVTELYFLQDTSDDYKNTWNLLERQIKETHQLYMLLSATSDLPLPEQAVSRATEAASAAFVTARNMLGLNWNR